VPNVGTFNADESQGLIASARASPFRPVNQYTTYATNAMTSAYGPETINTGTTGQRDDLIQQLSPFRVRPFVHTDSLRLRLFRLFFYLLLTFDPENMRFSSVFVATVAVYFSTSVAARAVPASNLEARKKCDPASTVTVTVTGNPAPTSTETEPMPDPTSAPTPGGNGGIFDPANFFPVPFKKAFTTLPKDVVQGLNTSFVELSLDALNASRISGKVTQDVVDAPGDAPDGVKACTSDSSAHSGISR